VLQVRAGFLIGWLFRFPFEHVPGCAGFIPADLEQAVDPFLHLAIKLVGDPRKMHFVNLLASMDGQSIQDRETGQLIAMMDQFLQHHVDDIGYDVAVVSGCLGDVL
jgi:hypothetical protein